MPSFGQLALALLQAGGLLLLAPLITGMCRVLRAKIHTRAGPGPLQDYRDIVKLLKRQEVLPEGAGMTFRAMPFVMLATLLLIAMALPILTLSSPLQAAGDLITVIYLLGLIRFFFALSGIDSGSTFAGIGASREATMGVLMEPVIILSLFVAGLLAGSTNLGRIGAAFGSLSIKFIATQAAVTAAFAFAMYVEMGKLPYDVAEAEQEVQEGPLVEYSGPGLALLKWSAGMKQVVIAAILVSVFLPFGAASSLSVSAVAGAAVAFVAKIVAVFFVVALFENSVARSRFFLASRATWAGFGVAALALVFYLVGL